MTDERLQLAMAGTWLMDDPQTLTAFLDWMRESEEFGPTAWAPDERVSLPFDSREVLEFVGNRKSGTFYVRREAQERSYELACGFGRQNTFWLEMGDPDDQAVREPLFAMAEVLCEMLSPDYCTVNYGRSIRPWENRDQMLLTVMKAQAFISPVTYFKEGPRGLAMRTYLGPRLAEQFPTGTLESSPLVLAGTAWGGRRLDLAEDPWRLTPEEALDPWKMAWDAVKPAKVFARVSPSRNQRSLYFYKGENCEIPQRPQAGGTAVGPN